MRSWMLCAASLSTVVAQLPALSQTAPTRLVALPGSPKLPCSREVIEKTAPQARIDSVKWVSSPVPYCRVDGEVPTTNPGPNTVGFMIALPQSWNGRYLMVIPGGSAGYIVNPSNEHLLSGYAVATTDKGSHSTSLNMSFRSDAGRSYDYAYRGAHVAAVATQAIAFGYYERTHAPRYIAGCSGGGVSTLTEAEYYPEDADGFVAAAAPTDAYVQTFWAYIAQHVARDPKRWISPEEMVRVGQVIMDRFDESDGVKDGLIWDPTRIVLDKDMFPFLSKAQFTTLKLLQDGLSPIKGSKVSAPGYWLANPSLLGPILLGSTPPPWTEKTRPPLYGSTVYSMQALRGADYDASSQMNFGDPRQREAERTIWDKVGGYELDPANLDKFLTAGAKLIFWAGASDEAIPPQYSVAFGNEVRKRYKTQSADRFRNFLVPGMFHCRGGENQPTDASHAMLQAMQRWVEAGEAPEQVILTNAQKPTELDSTSNTARYVSGMSATAIVPASPDARTYLICALPRFTKFVGENGIAVDILDARKWRCPD